MYEIYNVKPNDTLESIAREFETTVGTLKQINGLIDDKINYNTMIVVPIKRKQPYKYYTVQKGDTLSEVAQKNNIDINFLLMLNGLDDGDYIYPNQTIILPKDGFSLYITKQDDTLRDVVNRMGVTVQELIDNNENIYLFPEQILVSEKK